MRIIGHFYDCWENLHFFWRFLAITTVAGGGAFVAGRPALECYREQRDDRRVEEAFRAEGAGNYAQVRELSLAVLRRDPARKEVVPMLLRATNALNDSRRTEVALALMADSSAAKNDRFSAWLIACKSASTWTLQKNWLGLSEEEQTNSHFVAPLFDRMLRDGMPSEAASLLHPLKQPLAPEIDLRLMRLSMVSGTDQAFEKFQRHLINRLPELPAESAIVRLLDEIPQRALHAGLFDALKAWQESHPHQEGIAEWELRLARCQMVADPVRAGGIFDETLARFREEAPMPTALWCYQLGRFSAANEILKQSRPPADADAFRLHALVLEQLGDFPRLSWLLSSRPEGVSAAWASCEVAYLAQGRNDVKARDTAADLAFRLARYSSSEDALIELARQAERRGLAGLSRRSWVEAIRLRKGPLPLSKSVKGIIESLATEKRETELLETLTSYRLLEPGNPAIMVQHDYLMCLKGRLSPASVIQNLQSFHEKMPDVFPMRCVLALAHLRADQSEKAVELTDGEVDWFSVSPAYRAIRGISLQSVGREAEAHALFSDFPWNSLLPSEQRVLKELKVIAEAPRWK